MKTKRIIIAAVAAMTALVTMGCENNINEGDFSERENLSPIAKNIKALKENGLLDDLMESSRSAENDDDYEYMMRFINDTDAVLEEIAATENGENDLKVINALFNDGSVEDFAEAFSLIDVEKSKEYLDYINENLSDESYEKNLNARFASGPEKIKLQYMVRKSNYDRGAYANDMEWSTIGWYTGFCAATVAGFYLVSYGGFWTRIAGGIAAAAGAASMAVQLVKWCNCSDLSSFISAVSSMDAAGANKYIQGEQGCKIVAISVDTVATAVACFLTPFGKSLLSYVVSCYNAIVGKIVSILPSGVSILINGVPLATL